MDLYRRDIRRDVRDLGTLVGDVLTEQAPADAFEIVEVLRTDANAYRSSEDALDLRDPLRSTLASMSESWPFFRTILDSAALSLARTDLEIAAEYAALVDPEIRDRVFGRIREEHDRAVELVRAITGRETLVKRGWLTESLDRRNPYVDPLNLLQVRLLDRDSRSAIEDRALRLTVKGIAAGMKTTG